MQTFLSFVHLVILPLVFPPPVEELVKTYIWPQPQMIECLVYCYVIAMVTEWVIHFDKGRLNWASFWRTKAKYTGHSLAAVSFMFVSTFISTLPGGSFGWVPSLSLGGFGINIFLICAKHLSILGVFPRSFYRFFEERMELHNRDKKDQLK